MSVSKGGYFHAHYFCCTYTTMLHFVTEMCTCVHISVTKWCIVGYLSEALWDLWDGPIDIDFTFFSFHDWSLFGVLHVLTSRCINHHVVSSSPMYFVMTDFAQNINTSNPWKVSSLNTKNLLLVFEMNFYLCKDYIMAIISCGGNSY